MIIDIQPVTIEEKQELSNMLDGYLDVLSTYLDEPLPKPYKYLDAYFIQLHRKPLFIMVDNNKAGFILVNLKDPSTGEARQSIAEFSVLPEYRSLGVGAAAANSVFDMFPGSWAVR
ncbi:hypothetical protein HGB07_02940, partial [Candidatus Roizmanbacteria bacterium]|nr:hypothetical protein [Candidatus Roizmanbacteria bacterium]